MPLTESDLAYLREADARERATIKAFTTGEGTVEMAAKALSDVLRLRALIDRLAGEQQVVHARWKERKVNDEHVQYTCSECNDYLGFKGRDIPNAHTVRDNYKYCRNCGACMDADAPERGGKESGT